MHSLVVASQHTTPDVEIPLSALIAAAVAIAVFVFGRRAEVRDARRSALAAAYEAATSWIEAVYRVRRRSDQSSDTVVQHLHDLQEAIYFHRGVLSTRSLTLARAYDEYVEAVKKVCREPLQEAWADEVRDPSEWTRPRDFHPDTSEDLHEAEEAFLTAARRYHSAWVLPRLLPVWTYRVRHHDQTTPTSTSRIAP